MSSGIVGLSEPVSGTSRARLERGIAHAKAQSRKKAREEFCDGFLNSEGQAGAVVGEVVLGDAAGRYRGSGSDRQ